MKLFLWLLRECIRALIRPSVPIFTVHFLQEDMMSDNPTAEIKRYRVVREPLKDIVSWEILVEADQKVREKITMPAAQATVDFCVLKDERVMVTMRSTDNMGLVSPPAFCTFTAVGAPDNTSELFQVQDVSSAYLPPSSAKDEGEVGSS